MNRKNRFLNDKLRYAKRKTTKREFNFIPINPESGDAPNIVETEQTFALSPPKWASSPRDTPITGEPQKKKKKLLVEISRIEPFSGRLKISGPKQGTEQEDPTLNVALQILSNIQNEEKNPEAETNFESTTKTKSSGSKWSTKPRASSDNDSEESGRKSRQSSRRSSNSVSSNVFKSQRPRSGSRSSGVGESENEVPKTSKVGSYKESGGSASEGFSSRRKQSKTRDGAETVTDEKVSTVRNYSRKLSESKKSSGDSGNSPNEDRLPRGKRVSKTSSDPERKSTDVDLSRRKRSAEVLSKFEELVTASVPSAQKTRRKSSGSEKSADEVPSKIRKSSESGKSSGNDLLNIMEKCSSSEKSTTEGLTIGEKPIRRSSSSEKSTTGGLTIGEKPIRRSSSSEKSTTGGLTIGEKPIRRSSSSEKLTTEGLTIKEKPITRSSSSEKSTTEGLTSGKKPISRSSSSEKLTTGGLTIGEKNNTRYSSSEKLTTGGLTIGEKPITRSSISEKFVKVASFKSRKSSKLEKSTHKDPSTSRVNSHINNTSEISAGEGPSKPQKVYAIFQGKSNRSKSSRYGGTEKFATQPLGVDSSSDDQLFSPHKLKVSNQQVASKKGVKFKKTVKSKPKKIASRTSDVDPSSDEQLFNPQKHNVSNRQISSTHGKKSESKLVKSSKVDSAKLDKDKVQKSLKNLSKLPMMMMFHSESESEDISSSAKGSNQSKSKKKQETKTFKDISEEMSEEIPLQDKSVITTFAGLPLSIGEKYSTDENSDDEQNIRLEESIQTLEHILDSNKVKLNRIYDTSRELKLSLLQPPESARKRNVYSVTDLDVLWNFLGKSLHVIIKETVDAEKRTLVKAMRSYLEKHFLSAMGEQIQKNEMHAVLKDKSGRITLLTNKLLYLKQRNRQLAQKLYEKEKEKPPQNEDAILDKFEGFCQSFAQFKRT